MADTPGEHPTDGAGSPPNGVRELLALYLGGRDGGHQPVPWSWASLSLAQAEALAELLETFRDGYNRTWALHEPELIPACWRHHPGLAHDLAALAWAYYQAYHGPDATPRCALQFQADLVAFRGRVNPWLGADPPACRAGHHPMTWRDEVETARTELGPRPRDAEAEQDATALLHATDLGFGTH